MQPRIVRTWITRLMWFAALWIAGVAALGALAYILRRVLL